MITLSRSINFHYYYLTANKPIGFGCVPFSLCHKYGLKDHSRQERYQITMLRTDERSNQSDILDIALMIAKANGLELEIV